MRKPHKILAKSLTKFLLSVIRRKIIRLKILLYKHLNLTFAYMPWLLKHYFKCTERIKWERNLQVLTDFISPARHYLEMSSWPPNWKLPKPSLLSKCHPLAQNKHNGLTDVLLALQDDILMLSIFHSPFFCCSSEHGVTLYLILPFPQQRVIKLALSKMNFPLMVLPHHPLQNFNAFCKAPWKEHTCWGQNLSSGSALYWWRGIWRRLSLSSFLPGKTKRFQEFLPSALKDHHSTLYWEAQWKNAVHWRNQKLLH